MKKFIWNSFAIFGLLLFISLLIFFSQNTKIKIKLVKNFVFKTIGYGKDYNGFVANSFSDIKNIIIRGTKWRISGKNYNKYKLKNIISCYVKVIKYIKSSMYTPQPVVLAWSMLEGGRALSLE